MARSKDRPVLFEVVTRASAQNLAQSGKSRPTATPALERANKYAPRAVEHGATKTADSAPVPREAAVRFQNGRLHINLGWIGLSASAVGVVLVLLVAFQAGGRFAGGILGGDRSADDELSRLLAQTPNPSVLARPDSQLINGSRQIATPPRMRPRHPLKLRGDQNPAPAPSGNADTPFERQKGMHYVIVQYFPKRQLKAAHAAARFLSSRGVPCSVDTSGSDIRLFAHERFRIDQKDVEAARAEQKRCDALKSKIRLLGKEYVKIGGYAFDGCREHRY